MVGRFAPLLLILLTLGSAQAELVRTPLPECLQDAATRQCPGGVCPPPYYPGESRQPGVRETPSRPAPANFTAASVKVLARGLPSSGGRTLQNCGSGTVITEGHGRLIITCRHVTRGNGAGGYFVEVNGQEIPAKLLAEDDQADLAALVVENPLPSATLGKQNPASGSSVWVIGYPHGGQQRTRYMTLRTYTADAARDSVLVGDSIGGESGGGLFTDDGLVGVLHSGGQGMTYSTHLGHVRRFVNTRCWDFILGKPPNLPPPSVPGVPPSQPNQPPVVVQGPPGPPGPPGAPGAPGSDADATQAIAAVDARVNRIEGVAEAAKAGSYVAPLVGGSYGGLAGLGLGAVSWLLLRRANRIKGPVAPSQPLPAVVQEVGMAPVQPVAAQPAGTIPSLYATLQRPDVQAVLAQVAEHAKTLAPEKAAKVEAVASPILQTIQLLQQLRARGLG